MKKKLALLSLIVTSLSYGSDDFFYEESEKNGVKLEESVISTTGFETTQRNITNKVTVVTSKEIEEKNYQTVTEVLKDIPSVNVIGDPNDPVIDMRGQGKEKALSSIQILIDGVSTSTLDTNAGHTSSQLNTVPVENIEKIEVIPGGGAILYGSGTRGGIINIITKSGAGYNGGSVGGEFDSFGTKKGTVSYGTTFGKFGTNINYINKDYKGFRDGDESESEYFEGSLKYDISDKQNLTFKYSRYEDDFTTPRSLRRENLSNPESNGLVHSKDKLINGNTEKDELSLKYTNELSKNLSLDILGFYQQTKSNVTDIYGLSTMEIVSKSEAQDEKIGIKPKLKWKYIDDGEVIVGYDFINHNLKRKGQLTIFSLEDYDSDFSKTTNGVFVLNKNRYGKFEITEGIRYEHSHYDVERETRKESKVEQKIDTTKTEENLAYEFVANYLYSDTGNIYGKIESGFTSPAGTQLYNKVSNNSGGYIYEESNIDTERYITYELGSKDYILGSFVSGAIYLTESKDEINQISEGKGFRFENIGKTRRYGAELSAEQYFGKITLRESYSYVKTEILEGAKGKENTEGNEIANVPNHKLSLGLDYEINSKMKLGVTTVYSAGYYLNNENKGGKQNDHTVTNITLSCYPKESLRVYAGVNNIFNEKYYDSIDTDGTEFDPAAERNFVAGFKYNF